MRELLDFSVDQYETIKAELDVSTRATWGDDLHCPMRGCTKEYQSLHSLKRHFLTHNPRKEHKCSICQKSFLLMSYLKEHMNTHTGHKPYKCGYKGC